MFRDTTRDFVYGTALLLPILFLLVGGVVTRIYPDHSTDLCRSTLQTKWIFHQIFAWCDLPLSPDVVKWLFVVSTLLGISLLLVGSKIKWGWKKTIIAGAILSLVVFSIMVGIRMTEFGPWHKVILPIKCVDSYTCFGTEKSCAPFFHPLFWTKEGLRSFAICDPPELR